MNLTNTAETEVLNTLLRTGIYATDKEFALFTDGTNLEAGLLTDELSVASGSANYARASKTGTAPFGTDASGGTISNTEQIVFNVNNGAGPDWQTATHWGIVIGGGLKIWGEFTTPIIVGQYERLVVDIGGITIEAQ